MNCRNLPVLVGVLIVVSSAVGGEGGVRGRSDGPAKQDATPSLAEQVAQQFTEDLKKANFSFLTEARLAALREEIRQFAIRFEHPSQPAAERVRLLAGVDHFVARQFPRFAPSRRPEERAYLTLPDKVRTFEWLLWRALTRKPSPEQTQARDEQRKWLRDFLDRVPQRPGDGVPVEGMSAEEVRPWARVRLQQWFSDPLGLLDDAMTEKQFENFKRLLGYSAENGLRNAVTDIPVRALQARIESRPNTPDPGFDMPLPFDDKPVSIYGGSGFVLFASNDRFQPKGFAIDGWRGGAARTVYDVAGGTCLHLPAAVAGQTPDAPAVARWIDRQGKGELLYLDGSAALLAVRSARLAILDVGGWIEADRLSDDELRRRIAEQGKTSVPVDSLRPINGIRPVGEEDPRIFVAVENREKRLAVAALENREFGGLYFGCRARPEKPGPPAAK